MRMREGRIARGRTNLAAKLDEIERQRDVDIGRELLAGGFLLGRCQLSRGRSLSR